MIPISAHMADPALPIIAISGGGRLDATDFLSMAKKLGARHTLTKPFRRDQLLEAVGECLAEASGQPSPGFREDASRLRNPATR